MAADRLAAAGAKGRRRAPRPDRRGVEAATGVAIEGAGVVVRRTAEAERGRLETLIAIAIDASPGWRDIEVAFGDRRRRLPRAFEVLDAAPYGAGGRGIGSHLI